MYGMEGGSSATIPTKKNIALSFDLDDVLTGALEFPYSADAEVSDEDLRDVINKDRSRYPLLETLHSDDGELMTRQIATPIEISEGLLFIYPVMAMIETIKQLKSKGYLVVAATNQSFGQHSNNYRRVLRDHYGIDLNDLFRAVLTVGPDARDSGENRSLCYTANKEQNIHAVFDEKPAAGYFNALKHVVMQLDDTITKIIHIDDRKENVRGAGAQSVVGIHFDVPGGCVLSAQPEDLKTAVTNLKNELKFHGVDI